MAQELNYVEDADHALLEAVTMEYDDANRLKNEFGKNIFYRIWTSHMR